MSDNGFMYQNGEEFTVLITETKAGKIVLQSEFCNYDSYVEEVLSKKYEGRRDAYYSDFANVNYPCKSVRIFRAKNSKPIAKGECWKVRFEECKVDKEIGGTKDKRTRVFVTVTILSREENVNATFFCQSNALLEEVKSGSVTVSKRILPATISETTYLDSEDYVVTAQEVMVDGKVAARKDSDFFDRTSKEAHLRKKRDVLGSKLFDSIGAACVNYPPLPKGDVPVCRFERHIPL